MDRESTPDGPQLTVRQVLAMDCMDRADLLTGHGGLDREIRGVNIIEVPDVWRWLRGGELLFSAGYPWKDDPGRLEGLVADLERSDVSAMAFKPGQYVKTLPEAMLTRADALSFPIIRLPRDMTYREVIEPVYARLSSLPEPVVELPLEFRQKFTRFGLDEQSIEKVTGTLAAQIGRDVEVHDWLDDLLYRGDATGATGVRPLEHSGGVLARHLGAERLGRNARVVATGDGPALAAALVVSHATHGCVLVRDPPTAPAPGLEEELAYAAELISFLLLKRLSQLEGRREAGSLFFRSLMSDELSNEQAAERAITLGVRLTRPCTVLAVGAPGARDARLVLDRLRTAVERAVTGTQQAVVADDLPENRLIALLQTEAGELAATARTVEDAAARAGCDELVLAAGSTRTGLAGVRRSHSEALVAYATAERMGLRGLVRFTDLRVERLLSQIPNIGMMRDYVASVIGGIEDEPDHLRILDLYVRHGGNKVATAAAVPMHRSSLMYRLRKISEALGTDLNDAEHCLEIWLALKLRRLLQLSGTDSGSLRGG